MDANDTESLVNRLKELKQNLTEGNGLGSQYEINLLENVKKLTKKNGLLERILEGVERENHLLKQRLDIVIREAEDKEQDLQDEIKSLESQLQKKSEFSKKIEKDQATDIAELTAENARLIEHCRQSAKQAKQLVVEFKVLKKKFNAGCETLLDPCKSLKILNHQYQRVSVQKKQLKKRLSELQQEVARAAANHKAAEEQIVTLKKRCNEANHRVKVAEEERDELLESQVRREARSTSVPKSMASLFDEMEVEVDKSSLDDAELDPRTEMARACERLRQLSSHLKTGDLDLGKAVASADQGNCPPGTLSGLVEEVINLSQFNHNGHFENDNVY